LEAVVGAQFSPVEHNTQRGKTMPPKVTKKTPNQIAEEIAQGRLTPFEMSGKTWQGDVFYSDISYAIKLNRINDSAAFSAICARLRELNFYVHS
jgi:hypothetical protein